MEQIIPEAFLKGNKIHWPVKDWENKVYLGLLSGFAISLFLPLLFTNIFTILLTTLSIYIFIIKKPFKDRKNKAYLVLTVSLYISFLIGLFYSENIDEGLNSLVKKLSLLLFPLIFYINPKLSQDRQTGLLNIYLISAVIVSIFCIASSFYNNIDISNLGAVDWEAITYHNLSDAIGFHAIYLSMYVSFALFILLFQWPELQGKLKVAAVFCLLVLSIFLVLLSARIVLLAFLLITFTATLVYAYQKREIFKFTGIYIIVLLTCVVVTLSIPTLQTRVKEAVNYNSEYSIDKQWGGRAMRLLKWECCIKIIKENPVIGVGTGSEQDFLQECYIEEKFYPLLHWPEIKFNAHNQYSNLQ
ncbi:O-antigen ligase family protein [Pontibacter akesuensis]|uniref:O-antigen ligase family protein n=1 Tax=Pontibacter akesuensis TaxID=388950 RepID=UPI00083A768F|nr:O-antigen ligase family protein [Pontibacter akesuensis]